jgi:hypothetical protein
MQTRPLGRCAALFRFGALTMMAVCAMSAATTYTFRNGANGYTGAADASINTQYAQYNGGNGIPWKNDAQLAAYTTTGSDSYAVRYLLKFGNLSIPAGSQVVSATLSLSFEWWGSGAGNLTGFYVKNAWDPASNNLGWLHRSSTADWAGPGASLSGADTVAGKQFQAPALRAVGNQTLTMTLDPAVVQSWIDSPAANQGILLVNNKAGDIVRINSTVASQSIRPMLTVVVSSVAPVSVTLTPATATVQPGQTQQFTANVPVTWSATGGNITTAGLFTAGSTAGTFSVKATSTQDTTKSATATVTIQTLSVAPASATLQPGQTQQFTANVPVTWSATGGTISQSGLFTAGSTAGSFSVKATSTQDTTKSATATVTIQAITVSITPTAATLQPGQTRQFTANVPVTWSATGGTISQSGLFTAGSTAGSFTVRATSTQDTTRSATASVSIQATQTTVTVSPSSVYVFLNGQQQFTANVPVTWSATGGAISTSGLYTAGATTGAFTVTAASMQDPAKTASTTVNVVARTTTPHPRMILDTALLNTLRARAQANTAEWARIKSQCDSFLGGGTVNFIGQNGYPNPPNVGEGYQGSGYFDSLLPLGLCYQTVLNSNPTLAAQYGAKGVAILMAMSDPGHQMIGTTPVWDRDDGYGIRNFGTAMGLGYDWFNNLLTDAQKSQLQTALGNWIDGFEKDSFEYDHPQGNYFAGYYMAKCAAALAVQGDVPVADAWWADWLNHQHYGRVQPYYLANMAGGGWTEGFPQYGVFGSKNHALPTLAVKTAKGLDLIHAAQPYSFPLDQGRYLMQFTWPTRDLMDDRGELYSTGDPNFWPGTPPLDIYHFMAGFLAMWNDPAAPMLHKYARDVKIALDALNAGNSSDPWVDFLFWDPTAPEADYTTMALSYVASGNGAVSARSDWSAGATFMTFFSAPYINNPSAGHEHFDKGSIAIERNKLPLVVNAPAWMSHEPNGDPGWTLTYDDRFSNWETNHALGNRILYNTFQVRHTDGGGQILDNYGQWAIQRDDGARTRVARHEDGGAYVLTVGQYLEDMYRPFHTICAGSSPVTQWSRQIVYLRPSQFVVYDRTGVCDASLDQYLAFHFPGTPVETTAPATGLRRYNVTAGQFAGAITTVLPASPRIDVTDHFSSDTRTWNKVWRAEIRPTTTPTATRQWLTVFDLAPTAAQVANAAPITVASGAAVGTVLQSATGNSAVVMGTAPVGTPISGALTYTVPAAQTRHVVTDLVPSTGYTVSVATSGATRVITITQGGPTQSTANGVLTFVTQ